jgi:prepilin-type processing-associated H-X9-DG protein/prepilin-type N-terminal cleavage/methylation domain-containing protein
MRRRRSAFTLVELLVSIGIIAVLMSILLPTLGRVRRQAESTKCAANLHGMAQAATMYAAAYRVYPPGRLEKLVAGAGQYGLGDGADEYRPRWYELLGAQVKQFANSTPKANEDDTWTISNPWFLCPAVPEWINSRNYPYGYNHQFLGNARPKGGWSSGSRHWVNYPVPSSRIRAASETVMIADSMGTAVTKPRTQRQGYYNDGTKDPDAVGNKGYLLDAPRQTSASDRADVELPPNYHTGPDARHAGKVNVAFCDGHVDALSITEMGYALNVDGSIPLSGTGTAGGPAATNRLFSGTAQDVDPPAAR